MKATFGNPKYYKKCPSNFACGTPMENDENTAWFKDAPNVAKAKELFQKAGYDGRPVTLLHATNIDFMNNAAQIAAQRLRAAGINVQLATSDWGGVVTRRAVKTAARPGRLEHLHHLGGRRRGRQPDRVRRPSGERREGLVRLADERRRTRSCATSGPPPAASTSRRRSRARSRSNAWNFVPHVWLGQWSRRSPIARTCAACWRSRRSFRSGISRRRKRGLSSPRRRRNGGEPGPESSTRCEQSRYSAPVTGLAASLLAAFAASRAMDRRRVVNAPVLRRACPRGEHVPAASDLVSGLRREDLLPARQAPARSQATRPARSTPCARARSATNSS